MPPQCHICSFQQPRPEKPEKVFHHHFSSRQVRLTLGVERLSTNPDYMCPTCQRRHLSKPDDRLNVCVSDSQLHNFHFPEDNRTIIPPDSCHIDWITVPGASLSQLCDAWRLDYHREKRASRTLLVAGIDDLIKEGNLDSFKEQVMGFKDNIDAQNRYHLSSSKNEFFIAPLLNPPKLCWFPDNGITPRNYTNRLVEIANINSWINDFNEKNGRSKPPSFHTWGTRTSLKVLEDGSRWPYKTHRWNEWEKTERDELKVNLNDFMRGKMGKAVVKFFEGERSRKGILD